MIIRIAEKADAAAVHALTKELHKLHVNACPELFKPENCATEKQLGKVIKDKNHVVFIAEQDGKALGFCAASLYEKYYNSPQRSAFVDDLFVIPEARGKGIATALFEELKKYLGRWGAVSIDLCVWDFNTEAKAFYEKLGMKTQRTILEMKL